MSSSMALRRSPKPGALTAHDLERAAELVDDERREGFAFDVFGDDEHRLARLGGLAEDGTRSRAELIFFSWIRM